MSNSTITSFFGFDAILHHPHSRFLRRSAVAFIAVLVATRALQAQTNLVIESVSRNGQLLWSDADYSSYLYTVEWSSDLTGWSNSWSALRLFSISQPTNSASVPMFYRISKIARSERVLPPPTLVGRSVAIIGFNSNTRVDFSTTTNAVITGLDSITPPTSTVYLYEVVDTTTAFLSMSPPGIEGQLHFFSESGGTLDDALGKGFFMLK